MTPDELAVFNYAKIALRLCQTDPRPCNKFTLRFFLKDRPCLFIRRVNPIKKVYEDDQVVTTIFRPISEALFYKLKDLVECLGIPKTESWGYVYNYAIQGREKRVALYTASYESIEREKSGQKNIELTTSFDSSRLSVEEIDRIHEQFKDYQHREFNQGEEYYKPSRDTRKNITLHHRVKLLRGTPGLYEKELEKFYRRNLETLEGEIENSEFVS